MNMFLVNTNNPNGNSLMLKLAESQDGSIIGLTDGEMELYTSPDFQQVLTDNNNSPINISKIEKGGYYVAIVSESETNFSDLLSLEERLGITLGIVRTP